MTSFFRSIQNPIIIEYSAGCSNMFWTQGSLHPTASSAQAISFSIAESPKKDVVSIFRYQKLPEIVQKSLIVSYFVQKCLISNSLWMLFLLLN